MRNPSKPLFKLLAPLAAAVALGATPLALQAGGKGEARGAKGPIQNKLYIVQLREDPVVSYKGDIGKYKATAPRKGQKIDPLSQSVIDYAGYLGARHEAVLAKVGGGRKVYDYQYTFNGFAAELSAEQADKLSKTPGVLAVTKDELRSADTATTPGFLGLSGPDGVWATTGATGEGVVIGVIDTGIWPENPSFSDRTGANGNASKTGKLSYTQIPGWNAKCQPGEAWTATSCNQKLINATYFNAAWGGNAGIDEQLPWEFNSPRDYNGHGSHTSGTAGGNANTPTDGPAAGFGTVSGIAPRARIAMYKALWTLPDGTGSGFTTDLVAAIDTAVADGVDVINYSISGTRTNFLDPVEVSFLFAADAGVFVATSAGNSGPTTATVAHPSPWVTTVAAGTHNRNGEGSVTLGNGVTYTGASFASAVGPAAFIDSEAAGLPGADPTAVRLCFATADLGVPSLDPAKIAGKIVLCDRGVNARVNKSLAVQEAGGVGMVLVNNPANSVNADFHFVPSVHVDFPARPALKAYAATAGATASIAQATVVTNAPAPLTASFSSRGPLIAGNGDVLKPDVIAPGQDVLAAVAPPGQNGLNFNLLSGTSMSSPHVAGLAALFKDLRPGWSPMAIKSALMTTGSDVLDGPNTNPLVIFRQGAGHVAPKLAIDPGLVFNSNANDWLAFLCGTTTGVSAATCELLKSVGYSTDPSDMNTASIAIGALAGTQTVTRRVTNVGGAATYTPSYTGLVGIEVTFDPASLVIGAGQTKTVKLSFKRTSAALNAYTGGQVRFTDGTHTVRVPVVVVPVALSAPVTVSGAGEVIDYDVVFGYDGAFAAAARGLIPAAITADTVADDPTNAACSLAAPNAKLVNVNVPAGTSYARFALFDGDVNAGSDIDLCVFNAGGTLVGGSAGGTSAEEVSLVNPTAGTYTVVVHGWGVAASTPFKLHSWVLDTTDAGNMTVTAPAAAVTGTSGQVSLSFSGLAAGTRYLGSVAYSGVAGMPNPTIVRIDTP